MNQFSILSKIIEIMYYLNDCMYYEYNKIAYFIPNITKKLK